MTTFAAPAPVVVDVPFGVLEVRATERDDLVVTVTPTDPARSGSVRAAEAIRVERDADAIRITYPGSWTQYVLPFAAGTATITLEVPLGTHLSGKAGVLNAQGSLGVVNLALTAGDVRLDDVDRLDLAASAGSVVVGHVASSLNVKASAGSVRIGTLDGDGRIRSAAGTTTVATLHGTLEVAGSAGDVVVGDMTGTLTAKTAHGSIRVDRVRSGSVTAKTSFGTIEVGVPEGTAAWLDATTAQGHVRNELPPTDGPADGDETAEIHAATAFGDVLVRRA
ncbi:DUF4097 family beta strand repeat-containing protein [Sanguibacter sp. HDW7]|uniref:DUF4097 family beta strand repeat-containing protein n=1 Tax=Sanguibacter sp. HDW7 TaxID=2714931 RepID=UPI001409988E|nr:DUF4097 family beta strand repeat-containing protein [Sanguibacter sp. HDW7]QIK83849.1 DUF4097 domain-containing protein [Sanguibacter sp. HDW7]